MYEYLYTGTSITVSLYDSRKLRHFLRHMLRHLGKFMKAVHEDPYYTTGFVDDVPHNDRYGVSKIPE